MIYAQILVILGLVLLAVGLIRKYFSRQTVKVDAPQGLIRDTPADLKDTIYHPKAWRRPRG